MLYLYIIGIILCVIGLLFNKSIVDKLGVYRITLFSIVFIVMYNGNNKYIDLINYDISYTRIANGGGFAATDFGFYFIQKLASTVGLSFSQFKGVLFVVTLSIIYKIVRKYAQNVSFFILMYMIYYLFLDGEQLRNFLAFCIVLIGVEILLERKKQYLLKFLLVMILACSIHISAVVYFLLLLILTGDKLKAIIKKIIVPYLIVMFVVFRIPTIYNVLFAGFSFILNDQAIVKLNNYLSNVASWGFIVPTFIYFFYCLVIHVLHKSKKNQSGTYEAESAPVYKARISNGMVLKIDKLRRDAINLENNIELINIVGLLFLPLCLVNLTFYRLFKNITLLGMIYLNYSFYSAKSFNKKIWIVLYGMCIIIGWCIWDFIIYEEWEVFYKCYFG